MKKIQKWTCGIIGVSVSSILFHWLNSIIVSISGEAPFVTHRIGIPAAWLTVYTDVPVYSTNELLFSGNNGVGIHLPGLLFNQTLAIGVAIGIGFSLYSIWNALRENLAK